MNGNPWLVSKETKSIEIVAPNGEKATVELRRLNEGDRQDRENALLESRAKKGASEQTVAYKIGALRKFDVRRSVVSWSIGLPINEETLRDIEPSVVDQIHDAIRELNPFIFADDEDEDAESPTAPDAKTTSKN